VFCVLQNFSVVSVLAFILPTPGGGVVKVTKDHKKISCLMGPYNTDSGNHYINNHGGGTFLPCFFVSLLFTIFEI
jgi:hypothetical protein